MHSKQTHLEFLLLSISTKVLNRFVYDRIASQSHDSQLAKLSFLLLGKVTSMSFGHSVHQLPFQGGCVGQLLRRSLGLKRFLVKQMHSPWHWLFHTRTARQSARLTYAQYKTCWRLTGSGGRKICLYVWGWMQTARHVMGMCFSRCLALKKGV